MTRITPVAELDEQLGYLKLPSIRENYEPLAKQAAQKQWTHVQYLSELIQHKRISAEIAP